MNTRVKRMLAACNTVLADANALCELNPPRSEADIKRYLERRAREVGALVRNVKWLDRDAAPDKVVMLYERLPHVVNGRVVDRSCTVWVECKAPGKAATFPSNAHERAQDREHKRMRAAGQTVLVIDSYEGVEELFA